MARRSSPLDRRTSLTARTGGPLSVTAGLLVVGEIADLSIAAARQLVHLRDDSTLLLEQLDEVGVRSLSIVNLTAVFLGMVLALQIGVFLAKFGAQIFVSRIVGVSLLREMAPVLTALVVGGRVGAGITAEIGSMKVTEQIDAIRALGADPIRKLVAPRLIALLLMLPVLTIIADAIGVAGACLISVTELGLSMDFYTTSFIQALTFNDFLSGIGKAIFFGYFIGMIACFNGLRVEGGADGVGRATTSTVVASSVAVLIGDFFLSKLFLSL